MRLKMRIPKLIFRAILSLVLLAVVSALYFYFEYSPSLPNYQDLADYSPPTVSRIYAANGEVFKEYAEEYRVYTPISSIPPLLIQAFIAAEDKNFYEHPGIDVVSILRAVIHNVVSGGGHLIGGSTITQQLVKNLLLTNERTISRKIKEAILAVRISQSFTKEQILELYLNHIYLGAGSYGVAAAANNYFGKELSQLNVPEIAFLAGLPKAPSLFDPKKNYERTKLRRDYVLEQMYEEGVITNKQWEEARAEPIKVAAAYRSNKSEASYFAESVRKQLVTHLGKERFAHGGWSVFTSLNPSYQHVANKVLRAGIIRFDQERGYRGPLGKISLKNWETNLANVTRPKGLGSWELAVLLDQESNKARYTIGLATGATSTLDLKHSEWVVASVRNKPERLALGSVVIVEQVDNHYELRQIPEINGAIVVEQVHDGRVLAMSSGFDYNLSEFNRATQAKRQPGSTFKPFVYLAALENGFEPNQILQDEPISLPQGPGLPLWTPKNHSNDFMGDVTFRKALEKSRNLVTVRLANELGTGKLQEIAKRFGINDQPPAMLSMSLGSLETTLLRLTNAYAMVANGGYYLEPHFIDKIQSSSGENVYRRPSIDCRNAGANNPLCYLHQRRQVIDPISAFQLNWILKGAVERGTAAGIRGIRGDLAAKTGTSNDSKDIWFVAYTPQLVIGCYLGYDQPRELGAKVYGATHALPIVRDFIKEALADLPERDWQIPSGVRLKPVDAESGKILRAGSYGPNVIIEAFRDKKAWQSKLPIIDEDVTGSQPLIDLDFEAIY